jgi:predicted nucleic acid-binding protein
VNVYVESNFVLQLALVQEFHASCEAILHSCESGAAQLVVPAICLAEPDQTLYRQKQRRTQIKVDLDREFRQLARTSAYSARLAEFASLTSLLIDSAEGEYQRWEEVRVRLLRAADVVSLDAAILSAAARQRATHDLRHQDALVYASVLSHLGRSTGATSCFLNADKDFDDPDLVAELTRHDCKLIARFDDGYQYLERSRSWPGER